MPLDFATPPNIRERFPLDELREYATEMPQVLRDAEGLMHDDHDLRVEDAIRTAREMNGCCIDCGTGYGACSCHDSGGRA